MHQNCIFGGLRRMVLLLCLIGGLGTGTWAAEELGRELVASGNMEANGAWEGYCCGSATLPKLNERTAVDKHTGENSRHMIIERTSSEWPGVKSPSFATETGKSYQVRFWYKTMGGSFSVMMRNGASSDYVNFIPDTFASNYLVLDAARKELVWREFTGLYTEKSGGKGAYLCFCAASLATEFFVDDVSVVEVDRSTAGVLASWRKLFPKREYLCWSKSPWAALSRVNPPPTAVTECKTLALAMGENEYESASVVLTNLGDRAADFAVSAKDGGLPLTLREAVWVTTRSGNEVNDALPLLEGKLTIPSGESRELWLTFCSRGVKPGKYHATIKVTSPGLRSTAVEFRVKVYPVALPDDKPIYTSYWEYLVPEWITPELAQALTNDLKQHYVNTPIMHPWPLRIRLDDQGKPKQDYTELDGVLGYYRQLNPKMVLLNLQAEGYLEKQADAAAGKTPVFFSDEWQVMFKLWLTGLVSHLKEKGLGYDKFAIYPYDERLDQPVYNLVKLIKEIDPNILVYVNHTGTPAQAKAIAPYTDVWCPFLYDYLSQGPYASGEKNLAPGLLNKKNEFFWTYANPLSGLPQESSPYADYRLAVWRTWENGMNGFGYWIYSYKTHWNSYKHADGENWGVVYLANAKDAPPGLSKKELVVTGKRWEATREGIEDYVYLRLLKDRVETAGGKVAPGVLAAAKKVLAESPKTVLGDLKNSALADRAKEDILKILGEFYQ